MFTIQVIALLIGFSLLSLLLAYGRTRWFGKKFHRAVFATHVLENLRFQSAIFLVVWHTTSFWRLYLLGTAVLAWLLAIFESRRLEQAQRKISDELPGKQAT